MERRKFLIASGALAAGGAAAMGSGAFSSVEADRDISVEVADDSNAFLGIEPADTPNGNAYAEETDDPGTVALNFDDNADFSDVSGTDGGSGINDRAVVVFDDLLTITNQGTQPVGLAVDFGPEGFDDDYSGNQGAVAPTGDLLRVEAGYNVTLGPGESYDAGLYFNQEKDKGADEFLEELETIIFLADAEEA